MRSNGKVVAGVLLVLAVGVAVTAIWWLWGRSPEGNGGSAEAGAEAQVAARGRPARLGWAQVPIQPGTGELVLRGSVEGPDGPVPGALVIATVAAQGETLSQLGCHCGNKCGMRLLECGCGEAAGQIVELVQERRGESIPVGRAITDAQGRFEIPGMDDRPMTVWAEEDRIGVGLETEVSAAAEVVIVLQPGSRLDGRVVDEDDAPLRGAVVTAIDSKHSRFFDALTGDDGSFSFALLPQGRFRLVAISAPLLPDTEFAHVGEDHFVEITLQRPRTIAGRVEGANGPLSRVAVALAGEHRKQTVTTDAQGAFRFSGLRDGSYELAASDSGQKARETVRVRSADVENVVLSLAQPRFIEGSVRGPEGAAIAGAAVRARAGKTDLFDEGDGTKAETDAGGHFRLEVFRAAEYHVTATATGFLDGMMRVSVETPGETARADLTLERAAELRGIVVDPAGHGVGGVELTFARAGGQRPQFERAETETALDRVGEFTANRLRPGMTYEFRATADGYLPLAGSITVPSAPVRWVLSRGASIVGIVLDARGAPLAGVQVWAARSGDGDGEIQTAGGTSDAGGRFALSGLTGGEHTAYASRSTAAVQAGAMSHLTRRVRVPENGTAEITLRFEGTDGLQGVALDDTGAPVAGARISVTPGGLDGEHADSEGLAATALTGPRGEFALTGLTPGQYVLAATADKFDDPADQLVTIPSDQPVTVRFTRGGRLIGRVIGEGKPLPQFSINFRRFSDSGGRFEIPVEGKRTLELAFAAPGFASIARKFEVASAGVTDVGDVVLRRGRTLRGVVVDGAQRPVADALVDVGPVSHRHAGRLGLAEKLGAVRTRKDGTFALPNVADEPMILVVQSERFPQHVQDLPAQVSEVRVRLKDGGRITGTVALLDGRPAVGAYVSVTTKGMPLVQPVDANGAFTFEGVETGKVWVGATGSDPSLPSYFFRPVEVKAGETTTVTFQPADPSCPLTLRLKGKPGETALPVLALLGPADAPPLTANEETNIRERTMSRPSGATVRFSAIPPGSYMVDFALPHPEGIRVVRHPIRVALPCPGPIELPLEGGSIIRPPEEVAAGAE